MTGSQQLGLIETFETSKPPNLLFCRQEFLEKLAAQASNSIGRRTVFLMQRLAVDARRLHYKPTCGANPPPSLLGEKGPVHPQVEVEAGPRPAPRSAIIRFCLHL